MRMEYFRITNVNIAVIFMALYALLSGAVSTYIASMLTTIEKRFDFNSSEMGALMGANDIGYLACVILVAFLGSKDGRQPLLLLMSAVGLWLSSMIYIVPYFIFGPRHDVESLMNYNSTIKKDICIIGEEMIKLIGNKTIGSDVSYSQKSLTMFIFMIAGIINGVATSPFWNLGISYLDDMAGTAKSGIYIGLLFGIRSLAPIIGFLFGSYMSKLHESLKLNVEMYLPGQRDIKWIGAWWLGWLILGFAVLLTGPFLGLLKVKKNSDTKELEEHKLTLINETNTIGNAKLFETKMSQIKELYGVIRTLFKNRIYVSLIVGIIFDIISNICLFIFFTKYLEYHFRASTSVTNIFAALTLAGSRLISSFISGIISKTVKMSLRNMNRWTAIVNLISAIIFPILFIFTCPSAKVSGLSRTNDPGNCQCQYTILNPVCLNFQTYFSPCVAGCTQQINKTFFGGCSCNHTMIATKGFCEGMCPSIYGFLIAFFIVKVIGSLSSVQFITVLLRLCEPKYKAVNLAMIGFTFAIFGLSFPPFSGMMLDSACDFRNTNSFGGKSHCLLYNNDKMRYIIIGVSFIFQIPSCLMYIMAWIWTPEKYGNDENIKDNKGSDHRVLDI